MKTKTNISNLKKMALTAAAALVISAGSLAQSNKGSAAANELVSLVSLKAIMTATEQAIRYVAPEVNESEEFFAAAERLEMLANNTEAGLKYVAPEAAEDVAPVIDRLNVLAAATEDGLKYAAPEAEEEIAPVIDRLNMMADATEATLQYNAPEVAENSNFQVENENEVMLATYTK